MVQHVSDQRSIVFPPSGRKKKAIQTKYRMPLLNWQVLAANQVTGTVFNELDDEHVLQVGFGRESPIPPTRPCQPITGLNICEAQVGGVGDLGVTSIPPCVCLDSAGGEHGRV